MDTHYFLAFDIGATSGRSVLITVHNGTFELEELTRFPNVMLELHGKYYWDIYHLFGALKEGLAVCVRRGIPLHSIGIDTWGVDFGYIGPDGTILGLPRAYRDPYTNQAPAAYFAHISNQEVYRLTGIQQMSFNSLYQLYAAKQTAFSPLTGASEILFMPDLLSYMLTGKRVCEYTDASTSQLLNPITKQVEEVLLCIAGVPSTLVPPLVWPGTLVGVLTDEVQRETGMGAVPVIAVAGHDTASAVAAVPATNPCFAYLSSGTWSLMGIETNEPILTTAAYEQNFTNEGGVEGTTRFLKNITGMWLLEQCRKEWGRVGRTYTYPELVTLAETATPFRSFVNPDDAAFVNPPSMTAALVAFCADTHQPIPLTDGEVIRCIFESLAFRYHEVLALLREMAPFPILTLHVIGGGAMNRLLNQFTANATGIPVVAGPAEATAIGNGMVQARTAKLVHSLAAMRAMVAASVSPETFLPTNEIRWEEAYKHYKTISKN